MLHFLAFSISVDLRLSPAHSSRNWDNQNFHSRRNLAVRGQSLCCQRTTTGMKSRYGSRHKVRDSHRGDAARGSTLFVSRFACGTIPGILCMCNLRQKEVADVGTSDVPLLIQRTRSTRASGLGGWLLCVSTIVVGRLGFGGRTLGRFRVRFA